MECMRSFNFCVDTINNISGAPSLKQWATGAAQHFWQVSVGTSSTYNITGFKNINIYGIDVIGSIQTQTNTLVNGVIVNDWMTEVRIGGQQPLVGAEVTGVPNYYALDISNPNNNTYHLGRYSTSVRFADPYQSCKTITLGTTSASGIAYETLGTVNLTWDLNFVVFYKFEGE